MASVMVAAATLLAIVISVFFMHVSVGAAQKAQLQNSADLAALGAAAKYVQGFSSSDSCAVAHYIVQQLPDSAQIECMVRGENIRVELTAKGKFAWLVPTLTVRAVAGPAGSLEVNGKVGGTDQI